jgi:hypothetical protein
MKQKLIHESNDSPLNFTQHNIQALESRIAQRTDLCVHQRCFSEYL